MPDRVSLDEARWAVVEELDAGRWRMSVRDEADDDIAVLGLGIAGVFDVDVEPHAAFVLARLGLAALGSNAWHEDELGAMRARVIHS